MSGWQAERGPNGKADDSDRHSDRNAQGLCSWDLDSRQAGRFSGNELHGTSPPRFLGASAVASEGNFWTLQEWEIIVS
jgi:hypothetical protein